jgi:N-glycosylase/DNA lyase
MTAQQCESSTAGWSAWQSFSRPVQISAEVLTETLMGGQAFRWRRVPGPKEMWSGTWANCLIRVRLSVAGEVEWSAPEKIAARMRPAVEDYFAMEVSFVGLADQLPWRTDAILEKRLRARPGLRLLRQPFGETLLAFLCSSAKRIPHIAQMCEKMAERFGQPIAEGVNALPTWPQLAEITERDLRACGLGYRARFIHATAQRLADEDDWEKRIPHTSYTEAHAWLTALPGVGPKIADCVLLFGAAKYEAFPVDTWILKAMAERYGLHGWRPAQVAQFGRAHFGPLAGLAQQYLFSGERGEK